MYYDDYEYEHYYEPTIADEILMEYQQKMKDALLESIRSKIENVKSDNLRLKEENKRLKEKSFEVNNKERDLKHKEENLKREVEKEFYESNIGDTLKDYIEKAELWFADSKGFKKDKCSLCNNERQLVAKLPNGEIVTRECDCNKLTYKRVPEIAELDFIKFSKRNSRYQSDRKFYLSRTYSPSVNRDCYNYDYQEFEICHIIDEFNEDIIELHKNKSYNERLGFETKEECQKYCDWLNNKEEK